MPKPLPLLEDVSPVCCGPLDGRPGVLPLDEAVGLAVRLKALADPARLQLVAHLLAQPGGEACTCDLAPAVGLSEPTTSHHLKQLLRAGFVTKERRGANVWYRVVPDAVTAVGRSLVLAATS